jgi:hypothetical protein
VRYKKQSPGRATLWAALASVIGFAFLTGADAASGGWSTVNWVLDVVFVALMAVLLYRGLRHLPPYSRDVA